MAVHRVQEFNTWRPGYGSATVTVYIAGTTTEAALFTDESLTASATNPQTLEARTDNSISYGKFSAPLYTASAYYLDINSTDQTGVERPPIAGLSGENASGATVRSVDGNQDVALENVLARSVHVNDFGEFLPTGNPSASTATNTTTLTAAIGVAAANGGGDVILPDGTYAFTQITLPAGVCLAGQGHDVTILQSQTDSNVVTIGGDEAGLKRMTLDGVDLQAGSIGLYTKANDEIRFDDCEIKRFETGVQFQGGRLARWKDLRIDNCTTGVMLHGDNDASGGANGGECRHNAWDGGYVRNCTEFGVDFSYVDKKCWHNALRKIEFKDNTGTAMNVNGARWTTLEECWFIGNTTNLAVDDDDDTDAVRENTVIGLFLRGGAISGGAVTFAGTGENIVLSGMELSDVDFMLTLPQNSILLEDCTEDTGVTISGDGTKLTRFFRIHEGASSGTTSDATATKAWSIELAPGQVGYLDARAIANQRNGENEAAYHKVAKVKRPGSTLDYDNQTVNFTLGEVLTGGTSGSTARIIADSDSGATGTVTLRDIVGAFENNETITDGAGGSALANGTLTTQNVTILQADTIGTDHEDAAGLNAAFVANGSEIELQVTGEASKTYEWLVDVRATLT